MQASMRDRGARATYALWLRIAYFLGAMCVFGLSFAFGAASPCHGVDRVRLAIGIAAVEVWPLLVWPVTFSFVTVCLVFVNVTRFLERSAAAVVVAITCPAYVAAMVWLVAGHSFPGACLNSN